MSFQVIIFTPSKGSGDRGWHQIQVIIIFFHPSGLFPVLCTWKASPHPCEVGQCYYSPLIQLWEVRQRSSWRPLQESPSEMEQRDKKRISFSLLSSPYKPPWRNKQRKVLQPHKFLAASSTPPTPPHLHLGSLNTQVPPNKRRPQNRHTTQTQLNK